MHALSLWRIYKVYSFFINLSMLTTLLTIAYNSKIEHVFNGVDMKVHVISGFLGSGKTTAIAAASKYLLGQGKKVGVVTNDQGKFLIDTKFLRLENIPTVEVAGGCFCCNYTEFENNLDFLTKTVKPDVIFAESVGSCADVVATVMKPLVDYKLMHETDTSFSVFVDVRMLEKYLLNVELPFQDGVIYIFEKQIEESSLLVLNKSDLFLQKRLMNLVEMAKERYPQKLIISQSSLEEDEVVEWLKIINTQNTFPKHQLDINYMTYGNAEKELSWYDAKINATFLGEDFTNFANHFINRIQNEFKNRNIAIGHLKFLIDDENHHQKISIVSQSDLSTDVKWTHEKWLSPVDFSINARLECDEDLLKSIIRHHLQQENFPTLKLVWVEEKSFHPGFPTPTHRIN